MNAVAQRTEEWFADRAGKITASQMHTVMLPRDREPFKSGPRKGQPRPAPALLTAYTHQLAAERITGRPRDQVKAAALQWGQDVEPAARAAYQARRGVIVQQAGFTVHPAHPFIGASPDFLVGRDGGGEVKCPQSIEVHLATLIDGLPSEHIEQIQGGLWITDRKWWDFVSYHPDYPAPLNLYIQRVERDDEYIAKLERACLELEADVRKIVSTLTKAAAQPAPADDRINS